MATTSKQYDFTAIEEHWQSYWDQANTFRALDFTDKPAYYVLDMFPYPSGAGLHIGHPEGYTASDILGRYMKAKGHNVLHPMGWDAFGLPAEQHALSTGQHPDLNTAQNIANFKRQIKRLGFGIDWDREINTTDPEYYRWTQWIFLKLFKAGLAYVDEKPVWWCPALGTVLANEEVIEGLSERGSHPVERRNLRQWVLRITAYADRLLEGLKHVDWPDSTKRQQEAWIGRSEGANVRFSIESLRDEYLEVYTTRIDTLFGATFIVIAPEHPLLEKIVTEDQWPQVEAYLEKTKSKSDLARTDLAKDKSGVFSGAYAINPINGDRMPIWVADYVLMSYGTGVVMGVPGHDGRDYEFAKLYNLPVPFVLKAKDDPTENGSQTKQPLLNEHGILINSGKFNGMTSAEALMAITDELAKSNHVKASVHYKLRDWLFSRQRYWGEPFPIIWVKESDYKKLEVFENSPLKEFLPQEPVVFGSGDAKRYAVSLPMHALPLRLPEVQSYQPSDSGESPLANAKDWIAVALNLETGEAQPASQHTEAFGPWIHGRRETNTMPQWAGSCWYYLRYLDPKNADKIFDPAIEKYWGMPDFYIGGAEHAVLHLLYARFWHQFMYDQGIVSDPEPFKRLFHQGIILGEDGSKMSKSKGNTVDPDVVIQGYGADALRMFEMFLGPLEDMKPWNTRGIEGLARFLRRTFRLFITEAGQVDSKWTPRKEKNLDTLRLLHETIKKVSNDIEGLRFNTAISQMMVCLNHLVEAKTLSLETGKTFIQLVAPFAPHLAEELWERIGEKPSISDAPWPTWDESLLVKSETKIVVQVGGRLRGEFTIPIEADEATVVEQAKALKDVAKFLEGKTIVKTVYVPGKLVNFVVQ